VARHQGDLFDGKARLKQTARSFVAEVMEVQVLDAKVAAGATKCGSYGARVVGKDGSRSLPDCARLRENQRPGIITRGREQRNALMVSGLIPRILSVADREHALIGPHVLPFHPANLVQAHGGRNCELDDPCHRDRQAEIGVELLEKLPKLIVCRSPIPLAPASDQTQPRQCHASKVDWLDEDIKPVNGSGMRQDKFDRPDIDAERDGTRASCSAGAAIVDQLLAVDLGDPFAAQIAFQSSQRRGLTPGTSLPHPCR
jgi:hypothetical protein